MDLGDQIYILLKYAPASCKQWSGPINHMIHSQSRWFDEAGKLLQRVKDKNRDSLSESKIGKPCKIDQLAFCVLVGNKYRKESHKLVRGWKQITGIRLEANLLSLRPLWAIKFVQSLKAGLNKMSNIWITSGKDIVLRSSERWVTCCLTVSTRFLRNFGAVAKAWQSKYTF